MKFVNHHASRFLLNIRLLVVITCCKARLSNANCPEGQTRIIK